MNLNDNTIVQPFDIESSLDDTQTKIHLRCQKRNGRKCITIIEGLEESLNLKKMLKHFKKTFSCNGAILKKDQVGQVMQLSGDQRKLVQTFLIDNDICKKDCVVVHGV